MAAAEECHNIDTFLQDIQDYSSPIPENVIKHLMAESGMNTTDPRVAMVMNIATQKYISDVMNRCAAVAKERIRNDPNDGSGQKKMELQVSDLKIALAQSSCHFQINRPEFLVSLPTDQQ